MNLLSSSHTNDEISGQVAELVGFDQVELVTDLLGSRQSAATEVSTITRMLPYSCITCSTVLFLPGPERETRE